MLNFICRHSSSLVINAVARIGETMGVVTIGGDEDEGRPGFIRRAVSRALGGRRGRGGGRVGRAARGVLGRLRGRG